MTSLVLLANSFPFGTWEPFLETEARYYSGFSSVHIFSLSLTDAQREHEREVRNSKVVVHQVPRRRSLFYALNVLSLLGVSELYRELGRLILSHRLTVQRFVQVLVFFSRAHHESRVIRRGLRGAGLLPEDDLVIYAYRFLYQPYICTLLLKAYPNSVLVARAHRADLYEEVAPTGYLPLRAFSLASLDRVYCISEHGRRYLVSKFPAYADRVELSYLGTEDAGFTEVQLRSQTLRVVSCSALVPVKRVHVLVGALALMPPHTVVWDHYGDGPLLDELRNLASELLAGVVDFVFHGSVPNCDLVAALRQGEYDVFVNVSESEGLPVSIMEACSVGLPIVATDVGGTSEIVRSGENGILLDPDASVEDVARVLRDFCCITPQALSAMRGASRGVWELEFDANRNYRAFVAGLVSLPGREI